MVGVEVAMVLAVLGFACVFAGIALYMIVTGQHKKERCTIQTSARVVDFVIYRGTDMDHHYHTYYKPVYCFNANGSTVSVVSSTGYHPNPYKINEVVQLYYNPSNPKEIYLSKERGRVFLPLMFTFFSIICFVIDVLLIIGVTSGVISVAP